MALPQAEKPNGYSVMSMCVRLLQVSLLQVAHSFSEASYGVLALQKQVLIECKGNGSDKAQRGSAQSIRHASKLATNQSMIPRGSSGNRISNHKSRHFCILL